jgi:hypothetical protein
MMHDTWHLVELIRGVAFSFPEPLPLWLQVGYYGLSELDLVVRLGARSR